MPPPRGRTERAAGRPLRAGLEEDGGDRSPRTPGAPAPPPPAGGSRLRRGAGARPALPLRCGAPRPPRRLPAPYLCRARRRRRPSPGPAAAAAAPAGAGTERAAPPSRGPEERARERQRERRRMMWVPLLACLTAGIVSVPKCQRGPGALLGAVRLLAAVPGLCQRRKLPSCSPCSAREGRTLWDGGDGRAAAGRWGGGYLRR